MSPGANKIRGSEEVRDYCSWELYSKKKLCSTIKFFSSSNMLFIGLFLANTWKKNGAHCARLREKENLFRHRA